MQTPDATMEDFAGIDFDNLPPGNGAPNNGSAPDSGTALAPFTIWTPRQFLDYIEPDGNHLLTPKYLSRGQTTSIIGPPGVGKSRLVLNLGISQILSRPWCGLTTSGEPQTWLYLGDENSVGRLKDDLERILASLPPAAVDAVEKHLRIQAILAPEDGDLDLRDDKVAMRTVTTVQAVNPGVVVTDPLSSFYSGDLAKPGDMKSAVRALQKTIGTAAPQAALVILHHARTGRQNTLQAHGFDAGNFALGGKALLARSRCVVNLAEANEDGNGAVVVACAKSNDCPRFDTRQVDLNADSMTYHVNDDFSVDQWKATVEGKKGGDTLCGLKDVVQAVMDGITQTGQIVDTLTESHRAAPVTIKRLLARAHKGEYLVSIRRGLWGIGKNAKHLCEKDEQRRRIT